MLSGSILQYFWLALSDKRSWKPILVFLLSSRWWQVLLYMHFLYDSMCLGQDSIAIPPKSDDQSIAPHGPA